MDNDLDTLLLIWSLINALVGFRLSDGGGILVRCWLSLRKFILMLGNIKIIRLTFRLIFRGWVMEWRLRIILGLRLLDRRLPILLWLLGRGLVLGSLFARRLLSRNVFNLGLFELSLNWWLEAS